MAFLGDMFGGMDFSSLYGNMAAQQQQMPTQPTTTMAPEEAGTGDGTGIGMATARKATSRIFP